MKQAHVLIAKCALRILIISHYRTRWMCYILGTVCTAGTKFVSGALEALNSWTDSLSSRLNCRCAIALQMQRGFNSLKFEDLIKDHGPTFACQSMASRSILLLKSIIAAGACAVEYVPLRASTIAIGSCHRSVDFALILWKDISANDERRLLTLKEIFRDSESPVMAYELALWIVTASSDLEYVLGDFREGFEKRNTRDGKYSAIRWCRSQLRLEILSRLSTVCRIATVGHWIAENFFKHRRP